MSGSATRGQTSVALPAHAQGQQGQRNDIAIRRRPRGKASLALKPSVALTSCRTCIRTGIYLQAAGELRLKLIILMQVVLDIWRSCGRRQGHLPALFIRCAQEIFAWRGGGMTLSAQMLDVMTLSCEAATAEKVSPPTGLRIVKSARCRWRRFDIDHRRRYSAHHHLA